MPPKSIAVTGATGYIGSVLVRKALCQGWHVRALTRRSPNVTGLEHIPYTLYESVVPGALDGIAVLVHLAWNTTSNGELDPDREKKAVSTLLEAASGTQTRVIFVSTQAARANAPTDYGRVKWMIEQQVLAAGGVVVRPGQVYGGPEKGLFGFLCRLVRGLWVLPALWPTPFIQPIHVDDLSDGLLRIASMPEGSTDCYSLASPTPVSFTVFLRAIAASKIKRLRLFLPAPFFIVTGILQVVSFLGLPVHPERLKSLRDLPVMDTRPDLNQINLRLRPLSSGMCLSGDDRRRRLITEGKVLLTYVLRARPPSTLLRRYARFVEAVRGGAPMGLPHIVRRFPSLLALLEDPKSRATIGTTELAMRLDAATMIAEASPIGAIRFLWFDGGLIKAFFIGGKALAGEACLRIARFAFSPWIQTWQPEAPMKGLPE